MLALLLLGADAGHVGLGERWLVLLAAFAH